jgi:hypothetical protein
MRAVSNPFFERPIAIRRTSTPPALELDASGQPTGNLIERRRRAEFITPIPKPKKRRGSLKQEELVLDEGRGLTTKKQAYDLTSVINEVRSAIRRNFLRWFDEHKGSSDWKPATCMLWRVGMSRSHTCFTGIAER